MEQAARVVGTLYLIKNPSLLADFTDHGKLLFYERSLASGFHEHELATIASECKAIKARQKGKRRAPGHGSNIRKIAMGVGLGETCDIFHPDASGATLLTQQRPCVMAREAGSRLSKVFAAIRRLILSVTTHPS